MTVVPALRSFLESWSTAHCATRSLHPVTRMVSRSGSTAARGARRTRDAPEAPPRDARRGRAERRAGNAPASEAREAIDADAIVFRVMRTTAERDA